MSYKSRLPEIAAELAPRLDVVAGMAAELIVTEAQARVPVDTGRLRDAIHVEHDEIGEYEVIAGNSQVFYGHIVEHGGVRQAARPFMTPAAETVRAAIPHLAFEILRGL